MQAQASREEEFAAEQELKNFESLHPSALKGKANPKYSRFNEEGLLLTGVAEDLP